MLNHLNVEKAMLKSAESDHFCGVEGPFGWQAKLEHKYDIKWEATLWNDDNGLTIQCIIAANDVKQAALQAANYMVRYHNIELYPKRPDEKIRDWYTSTCPTDECGQDINENVTFIEWVINLARCGDPYIYGIDDSLVRQRVMAAASHCCGVPYNELDNLIR